MRIAIIGSRGYPAVYGGFETFVREFVPHAIAAGHELVIYCREPGLGRRAWVVDGAECRSTPGLAVRQLETLSFGLTASLDARRRSIDAALVLSASNGYWVPLLESAGIPTAVNVDGIEWDRTRWSRLGRAMFKLGASLAARRARLLIADSQAVKRIWAREFAVEARFIPYGGRLLEDPGADALGEVGLEPGGYVLVIARLAPENNVELALDGWRRLAPGSRPPLVIVGSSPDHSRLRRRIAHATATDDRVRWLGTVDDQRLVDQLWSHCAVYLHGHSVGGTNPSLLRALGAGAPTLAFDTQFNREVIGEVDAYYGASPERLAQLLGRVLASPERRRRLSEHGRCRVGEHYRWRAVCDSYLATLAEVVDAPTSGPSR